MKKNNKGYSFVELIITMAIFSIIMLAIILMMRTSLVSYKDGLFETTMQEEAQMAANQVSDLLVDATYINSWSNAVGAESYSFIGPEGAFTLRHETTADADGNVTGGKLVYRDAAGNEQLISDQMKIFYIDGLQKRADGDSNVYDNAASINVGIDYQEKTYSATKEVYFRNNIENIVTTDPAQADKNYDPFSVEGAPIQNNNNNNNNNQKVGNVLRYHPLDISAEFDIIADAKIYENDVAIADGGEGSYFTLVTANNTTVDASKLPSGMSTPHHYTVKSSTVATTNLNTGSPTGANAAKYYVTGKNSKNQDVKVLLQLDPVWIGPEAGKKGVCTMKAYSGDVGDNGYASPIPVKGIHINDAIKAGVTITYTAHIKKNNTVEDTYTDKTIGSLSSSYAKDIGKNNLAQKPDDNSGWPLGIAPEPAQGGLVIFSNTGEGADQAGNHGYSFLSDTNNKNELDFTLKIGGNSTNTAVYAFVFSGMSLEKYNP